MAGAAIGAIAARRCKPRDLKTLISWHTRVIRKSYANHTPFFKKTSCPYPRHFLKAPYQRGPFVYRLGRQVFNLKRRVRLPYGLPLVTFPISLRCIFANGENQLPLAH